MLNILASTFLTATRQEGTDRADSVRRPENPLSRVRTGGLILSPDRRG